jgi:hypothetical protein
LGETEKRKWEGRAVGHITHYGESGEGIDFFFLALKVLNQCPLVLVKASSREGKALGNERG